MSAKLLSAIKVFGVLLTMVVAITPAFGASVGANVPGTANPYLAGMPDGSQCCFGDSAPSQSPVGPFAVTPGSFLTFTSVSGSAANGPACVGMNTNECSQNGPDGRCFFVSQQSHNPGTDPNNGIAGMNSPLNSLVGVFLDNNRPDLSATPPPLDFSPGGLGTGFSSLAPGLKQPFFIGDGFTGTG